jgi:phospholipid/cholesterol/gamma-HCH transport system substrate-binding protein
MEYRPTELIVGFLMACLMGGLIVLSTQLGQVDLTGEPGYVVRATFPTAGGLQEGALVELTGVKIGQVEKVELVDNRALATLRIDSAVALQTDVRAAIKAQGLVGERYVEITPGQASTSIPPGGQIVNTDPPVDIQGLLGELLLGGAAPPAPQAEE